MQSADPMLPQAARVESVRRETHDTLTLQVSPLAGEFQRFQPGQFSMLYVFGVAELPISISGDPETCPPQSYTVRSVGQATAALVAHQPQAWLGVRGPFGRGWPMQQARGRDLVVIAGGIGLAPLRPVLYQAFRHRGDYGRVILLYGARSPEDVLYRQELRRWEQQPNTQVLTTVDYGGLNWRGNVGVVTTLFRRVRLEPAQTVALVCGPEIMMRYVALELERRGVEQKNIYLSMERNMKCGIGLCGHCQFGPAFTCKDGPVFSYDQLEPWLNKREI